MNELRTIIFDETILAQTRTLWVDSAIAMNSSNDLIELTEQFFDEIQEEGKIGDFFSRESRSTYIGIADDDNDDIKVIVEVSYHRRGKEKTLKIMDHYVISALVNIDRNEYDKKYTECLIFIIKELIGKADTMGSVMKIFARNEEAQRFITLLHESASSIKEEFTRAGLDVQLEGRRWLSFKRIN